MADVYLAKTFGIESNCYLVVSGNDAAIIDPSVPLDRFADIGEMNITKVLLTHGHFDHILCLGDYVSVGAEVYISPSDAPMLKNGALNASVLFGLQDISFNVSAKFVSDGDTLKIGEESVKVISTPGHTEGSVCYQIGDALFTGDTLFCGNIGRCDLPGGSFTKMKASLKKLAALQGDFKVDPGHDALTYLSKEKKTNFYMSN